jgi:HTH-type transcriptional regulator/antitoxin HigA
MNLESAYRLSLVKRKDEEVGKRAKLYSLAPVKDMIKRQWIRKPAGVSELEQELKGFFGAQSLDTTPQLPMAAKKSATYQATTPEQLAWAFRVWHLAKAVRAAPFTPAVFEGMMRKLSRLIGHEADVRRVPALLAEGGVRLVLVEHLPRSYMDGVATWIDEKSPVVGISTRYDRIDNFWFTLCHELAHIRRGDSSVDERLVGEGAIPTEEKPESEQQADREAADFLVSEKEMADFILRIRPLYYREKIVQFANRIHVHPGIIVGQLQRRKELTYAQLREFLVKVRDTLKPNVLNDGWGFAPLAK